MIDVHAHLFFDELLGTAGALGPEIRKVGEGRHEIVVGGYRWPIGPKSSLAETSRQRVDSLDEDGIDVQVLSLSPLWLLTHTPTEVAQPFLRSANTLMADWCAQQPDRLKGFAALPTVDVGAAVRELEFAVRELGLVGAYIGTDARASLDHPDLDDLYQACVDLDVPLFVHSTVPGVDGPAGDPRLERFDWHVTLGYPHEETLAVASLLFGGVLARHPRLDVYVSHGGGSFAFQHGRLRAFAALPRSPITVEEFDRQFARLWFDTHVNSEASLALLRAVANPDRLVFGTNYRGWDSGSTAEVETIAASVVANAGVLLRAPELVPAHGKGRS
ncbi:amidohydrolase family protein [Demequina rhizosphaerae]|uniref:amidohydrolase family protein n=1 Tax=Demequina rhizosphaerae TaxID=1638985 RepID=UPI00078353DA|nr:amidohydrolase family protein [Demequina rhizosphaerae]